MADETIHKSIVLDVLSGKTTAVDAIKELIKQEESLEAKIKKAESAAAKAIEEGSVEAYEEAIKAVKTLEAEQQKQAADQQKQAKAAAVEQEKAAKAAASFGDELSKIGRSQELDTIVQQYRDMVDAGEDATQVAAKLETRLKGIGATEDELRGAARAFSKVDEGGITKDTFGDASTGLSGLAGAAGAVGAGGASEVLRLGADLTGAAEQIPKLGKSVVDFTSNLGTSISGVGKAVTASEGFIGTLATGISTLAPVLGAAGAGFAAVAAVALPIAAIAVGVVAGIAAINAEYERQKKAAQDYANNIAAAAAAQAEAQVLIEQGNIEALDDKVRSAKAEYDLAQKNLQNLYDQKAALEADNGNGQNNGVIEELQTKINDLIPGFNETRIAYEEVTKASVSSAAIIARGSQEQKQAALLQVGAIRTVSQELAEGLTSSELEDAINRTNEALAQEAATREELISRGLESSAEFKKSEEATAGLNATLEVYETDATKAAAATNDLHKSSVTFAGAIGEITTQLANGLTTDQLNEQVKNTSGQIIGLKTELEYLAKTVGESDPAYKAVNEQVIGLNAQYRVLTSETTKLAAAQNTAIEGSRKLTEVLASYDSAKAETASKRQIEATQAAQDADIAAANKKQDRDDQQLEAFTAHQEKIKQIEANGLKAVEGIRKELADGIAKQLAAISDAEKDLTKLDANYRKQELARKKKFEQDKADLEKQFQEDKNDLIASGSFDALADLQRQNKKDKKNLRTEFKGGKSDAKDEFDEQKALAEEKIAALKVELDAFKTNEADKLKAAQEQTTAAIDAENKAFEDQEKKREAAYQKQDEREQQAADLRAQRLAEAQQREDAALDARTAKQLEAIGTVEARQEAATLNASAAFDLLDISIGKLVSTAAAVGGATAKGIGDAIAPSVTTPPIKAYAKGGLIDKPTLALMGEKGKELVLPYEPSKGLPAALNQGFGGNGKGGAGSVSVQVDGTMQVTIEGGADAGTVKKLERMLDERDVKLVKVMNRSLHTILDGKEPV